GFSLNTPKVRALHPPGPTTKESVLEKLGQTTRIRPLSNQGRTGRVRPLRRLPRLSRTVGISLAIWSLLLVGLTIFVAGKLRKKAPEKPPASVSEATPTAPGIAGVRQLVEEENWRRALDAVQKLGAEATRPEARWLTAKTYYHMGDLNLAMTAVRGCLAAAPNHSEAARLKAILHVELAEWQEAVQATSWALRLTGNQNDDLLFWLRGGAHRRLGHMNEALKDLSQALDLEEDEVSKEEIYFERGQVHAGLGLHKEALEDCDIAARLAVESEQDAGKVFHYLYTRGLLAMRGGRFDTAVQAFNLAETYDSSEIMLYYNRLESNRRLGDWEAVLDDCEILKKKTKWTEVVALEKELTRLSRKEEMNLAEAEKATAARPNDFKAYHELGLKFLDRTDYPRAIDQFDKAIKANKELAVAYVGRAEARVRLSRKFKQTKKRVEFREMAIRDCNEAIKRDPGIAGSYIWRGWAVFLLGRYPEARRNANIAARLAPSHDDLRALQRDLYVQDIKHQRTIRPRANPSFGEVVFGGMGRAIKGLGQSLRKAVKRPANP
ncbi:MAG: tetratricopeptide repeat protein, partial [Verrucomicrobiota bacterium]